jgi:hypothetical protein
MTEETNITPSDLNETAAPDATPQGSAEATPATQEVPDFRSMLPEEYRSMYPEFKKPEDFVKGYDELVRKMGSSISIPKEDASPEDLDKFYSKLGRPEDPDKYELELAEASELDKEFLGKFKQAAFENGINQKQAKQLFDWYNQESQAIQQTYEQQQMEAHAKAEAELKVRWGGKYHDKLEEVRNFAKNLTGDEGFEKLAKYGNDPEFISLLATMQDRYVKEDRLMPAAQNASPSVDYREQARKLMADPDYKFNEHKQAQVRDLYKKYTIQAGLAQ